MIRRIFNGLVDATIAFLLVSAMSVLGSELIANWMNDVLAQYLLTHEITKGGAFHTSVVFLGLIFMGHIVLHVWERLTGRNEKNTRW